MSKTQIITLKRDQFCLKASVLGNGPVALAIGSHTYYPRTFSELLTTKLKLVCADTRGFVTRNSQHRKDDFTLDNIVVDTEIIRKSIQTDKVIIIGHSIHAFMALEYAQRFPDAVSHLVLIASSPIGGSDIYKEADRYFEESVCPERKAAFAAKMRNLTENTHPSFIERMIAFGPRLWYNYLFDASPLWKNVEVNTIGADIIWGSMFANYNTEKALKTVQCPILLALGRYDYFNPPHLWEKYRDHALDLTIRIFEKSSHTPQLEEPKNFDDELLKWLEQKI